LVKNVLILGAGKFAAAHIDAVVFSVLTTPDLEKLGITSGSDQKKILGAAAELFAQRRVPDNASPPAYEESTPPAYKL
jgi:hypothetical protein